MAKFNIGDKVRILDVDEIIFGDLYFSNGDITEVVGFFLGDEDMPELKATKGSYDSLFIDPDNEGHAIEKVDDGNAKEFDIDALIDRVAKLEAKVAELEGGELSPSEEEHVRTLVARKSTNEQRKEVLAKARDLLAKIQTESDNGLDKSGGNETYTEAKY